MTATELIISQHRYNEMLIRKSNRFDIFQNKMMGKATLRMMTNYGPILGIIDTQIIVNRMPKL